MLSNLTSTFLLVALAVAARPYRRHWAPTVKLIGGERWLVSSNGTSRTYLVNTPFPRAIVDSRRRRIVVPASQFLVGLNFSCREMWRFPISTAFDPRPLLNGNGVVVAGINRIAAKRFPGTPYWREIVEADKALDGTVGLDTSTGRVRWRRSLFEGGSPICGLSSKTFIAIRIANEDRYLRDRESPRYALQERVSDTGRLLHTWIVERPPVLLREVIGEPPGDSVERNASVAREPRGWILTVTMPRDEEELGYTPSLRLTFPLVSGEARCFVFKRAAASNGREHRSEEVTACRMTSVLLKL